MAARYGSQPFAEQIRFFQQKQPIPTARWDDIWQSAHDTGFMVAGAAKANLLNDLQKAVQTSIEGGSIAQFRKDFDAIVERRGWTGWTGSESPRRRAWRTRVIYETNLRSSYAAGRWEQIQANKAHMPYLQYKHSDSVRHPRPLHQSWDGLVLHADDPWWQTHAPPNGWGCKCRIVAMSEAAMRRRGLEPGTPPDDGIDPKTGAPAGIDKGWAYAPGASRPQQLAAELKPKAQKLPPDIKAALLRDLDAALAKRAGAPVVPLAPGVTKALQKSDFTGQRPGLFELTPVKVVEMSGKEFGVGANKSALLKAADDHLRALQRSDGLPNTDTGWSLSINKYSRKKMGNNHGQSAAELQAVAGIDKLARFGVVAERHPDLAHDNPDVSAILRLYVPAVIDSRLYRVKLTVKEYTEGKTVLHALENAEIENALPGNFPSYSGTEVLQTGQPTTGRTLSIADLLRGAVREDGSLFAPE